MAQAARLSLRMQKELKLLLSDPPHGATFPDLSAAGDSAHTSSSSSSSSLTTIDAEIEGPEGTVYSGGIFKIRIQIPERYPFQPPVVTFATPIYHPNIDNGGRICLDILNLPPKGAWQPSLNVSTVITSIGLLLSEPNPDDGLMCEASREFKYNRQAFDLKARTMTEKYAKANASSGMVSNTQASELPLPRLTGDIEVGHEIKTDSCITNVRKPREACKKLSLDLSVTRGEKDDSQKLNTNEIPSAGENSIRKKQKLSLSSLSQPKPNESDRQNNQNNKVDQQVPSQSTPTSIQAINGGKLQTSDVSNPTSQGIVSSTSGNNKRYTGKKKLSLGISSMPKNQDKYKNENIDESKENLPCNSMKPEFTKQAGLRGGNGGTDLNKGKCKVEGAVLRDHGSDNKQQPDPSLTVIVLDSDESDEEDRSICRRSKLSLMSKRPIKL